jgi:hypothetical protein
MEPLVGGPGGIGWVEEGSMVGIEVGAVDESVRERTGTRRAVVCEQTLWRPHMPLAANQTGP